MAWKVKFFQTDRGQFPVKDFIEEQNQSEFAKLIHSIELLESFGPFLKPPHSKKLQDNLYELRVSGKVAIRIFYTHINNEYYLLHALKKKSQKTPSKDIKIALDRQREII